MEIIAGLFSGETGRMEAPKITDDHNAALTHPLLKDEALLGDIMHIHYGPHVGWRGTIEWIVPDNKGYDLAVGDIVEVAKGNWYCHQGVVKVVNFPKALLDIMCSVDRNQVAILTSVLLNGTILPPAQMQALMALHEQSFTIIPPSLVQPFHHCPLALQKCHGPMMIFPNLPLQHHLKLAIFPGFSNLASAILQSSVWALLKHVIWTAYPNPFCGEDDPVPPGCVCVTVTGHNAGSGIQHLKISACYLTPANPTGKNPLSVIKGLKAGRVSSSIKFSDAHTPGQHTFSIMWFAALWITHCKG
ncbi:hypothetical protein J3A83DRAFT_4190271 [Scleroderma citrinum]